MPKKNNSVAPIGKIGSTALVLPNYSGVKRALNEGPQEFIVKRDMQVYDDTYIYFGDNKEAFISLLVDGNDKDLTIFNNSDDIKLTAQEDIDLTASDDIHITADEDIELTAGDDIELTAVNKLIINVGDEVDITGDVDCNRDLNVDGELKGARESFTFSYGRGGGARYAKIGELQTSAGQGYIMPRNGSIVSISVTANVNSFASGGNMDAEARIGGTPMFQKVIDVTGAGLYSGYATQARDTDTFVAGNSLEAYIDIHGIFRVYDVIIVIEVQFDT
jgi:hypothetical protein